MSFVATSIAGGVSALAGSALQAGGARDAAALQGQQQGTNVRAQAPYTTAGYGAQSRLNTLLGIGPQTATGAPAGVGGSPLNQSDFSALDKNWGAIRGAANFGDVDWSKLGGESGLSPEAQQYVGGIWGQINPAAQLSDVDWSRVGGSPGYAPDPAAGGAEGGGSGEYGSLTRSFSPEDFLANQDPGYGFELQQGTQALRNAAGAGSGALSGAALKDLLGYSQGFARTGYTDAFNRYQTQQGNIFNRLSGIAQMGQNAAAGVGSQGVTLAGNAGQAVSNAGAAMGAGIVGAGNAATTGAGNYWLRNMLQPGG